MSKNTQSHSINLDDNISHNGKCEIKFPNLHYIAENLTFVGPKYICGSKVHIIRRCAWLLFTISLAFGLFYLLANSLNDYYRYETTKITRISQMDNVTLPAVTVCRDDISFQLPSKFLGTRELRVLLNKDSRKITNTLNLGQDYEPSSPVLKELLQNITWLDLIFAKTENTVKSCYYLGQPCSVNVTRLYNYADNRPCFTFHSQEYIDTVGRLVINRTGYKFSINIELYKQHIEMAHSIKIHDPQVIPETSTSRLFSPGEGYIVGVQKEKNNLLGSPYSNCLKTDLRDNELVYSMEKCKNAKREELIYSNCNCTIADIYGINSQCSAYVYLKCASKLFYTMETAVEHACAPQCQEITYKLNPSVINYKPSKEGDIQRISFVQLYFESFAFVVSEEVPLVRIENLFSNFGGLIGLFVGISSLSVIELIDLICVILCKKILNIKK